jgi:RNA 2',3'-cyclic 3'-phosphodiesterase
MVDDERGAVTESQVRAFVAVELPDEIRAALTDIRGTLSERVARAGVDRGVRWTDPAGVHLTLKFLGATSPPLLPDIERRLAEALVGQPRFSIELSGIGAFPNLRSPRVLWVGLGGDVESLAVAQRLVEAAISPLGFPTEARPFSPHLTLARLNDWVTPPDRQVIGEIVARQRWRWQGRFEVTEISLMRSELVRGGARYTQLLDLPLA